MLELGTSGSAGGPGWATAQVYPTKGHDRRTQPEQHYARRLDDLRKLSDPTSPAEFQALQQIAQHVKYLLRRVRPRLLKVAG